MAKTIQHALEAGLLAVLEKALVALGPERASAMGAALLRRLGPLTKSHRRARTNLARVFPPDRVEELLPRIWDNLGRTFFEYPHLHRLAADRVEVVGIEHVSGPMEDGRGCIMVSGHLANWEMLCTLPGKGGFEAAYMYRAPNNPHVDAFIRRCRSMPGVSLIRKSLAGTRDAFTHLGRKGAVGFLMDHRFNRGLEVDFLGGRASVAPTIALMAYKTRSPIVMCRTERVAPARYRITLSPLEVDYTLGKEEFQHQVTQAAMTQLAAWIMERPEQWFWMQRLWV